MRHRKSGVKLNRTTSHRQAMFRNMVTSLFKHDRIKTTDAKAKELRRWADHIVTLAKRGDLHARRLAMSIVREKDVVHKIFEEASERYGNFNGGYTRMIKVGRRPGDTAAMTLVELVRSDEAKPAKKLKTKKKADAPAEVKPSAPVVASDDQPKEEETQAEASTSPDEADAAETDEAAVASPADSKQDDSAEKINSEDTKKDPEPSESEK
jgi:large subunit ribosomal protein L17